MNRLNKIANDRRAAPLIEIKKMKSCDGRDGVATSCEIWVDGQLAAHFRDDGNGGLPFYDWVDAALERRFTNHIASLPPELPDETWRDWEREHWPEGRPVTADHFIAGLCDDYEISQKLRRLCRQKTVFRLEGDSKGEVNTINTAYSASVAKQLREQHGDALIEILNENPKYASAARN